MTYLHTSAEKSDGVSIPWGHAPLLDRPHPAATRPPLNTAAANATAPTASTTGQAMALNDPPRQRRHSSTSGTSIAVRKSRKAGAGNSFPSPSARIYPVETYSRFTFPRSTQSRTTWIQPRLGHIGRRGFCGHGNAFLVVTPQSHWPCLLPSSAGDTAQPQALLKIFRRRHKLCFGYRECDQPLKPAPPRRDHHVEGDDETRHRISSSQVHGKVRVNPGTQVLVFSETPNHPPRAPQVQEQRLGRQKFPFSRACDPPLQPPDRKRDIQPGLIS